MITDVAIVGAGPSGSLAAYRLARSGARVTLFDPSHPREKPCGGGVTGRALALVADALDVTEVPAVRVRAARFLDASSGASATILLPARGGRHALIVAPRAAFDEHLFAAARRAGAEVHPVRVADVARTGNRFRLRLANGTSIEAGFVIGADGANSLVRRRLSVPFGRHQLSIATGFFAHGVTGDEIVVEFVADPPGYLWSFPRPDHLAIGICAAADAGTGAEELRARTLRWMHTGGVGAGARLEGYAWPIPSLSPRDLAAPVLGGPGWCLVGDAAGLVDPLTREGIFFALQSAQFAAEAIAGDRASFDIRVRDEIVAELARAARFKEGFFRPGFIRLLMDALVESPRIGAVMADLVAGTQSYRDLKWRLAKTREFGYALKVLGASLQGA